MTTQPTWDELKDMSDAKLIKGYNREVNRSVHIAALYRDELWQRRQTRLARNVERCTWWIAGLTLVITALTIANVYLVWSK